MEDSFQLQCEFYIRTVCLSEKKEDFSMYALRTYVVYLVITQDSWVRGINFKKESVLLCAKAACLLEAWSGSIRSNLA